MESTNKWQIARRTTSLHNREVWQRNEHVTLSYRQICLCGVYDSFVILLLRKWPACIDRSPTEMCIRSIVNVSRQLPTGIPDILNRSLWWIVWHEVLDWMKGETEIQVQEWFMGLRNIFGNIEEIEFGIL